MADVQIRFRGDASSAVGAARQTQGAIGGISSSAGRLGKIFARVGLLAAGALTGGLAASVKIAASFEKTMDQVGAVSGATAKQMQALESAALKLGASTKFSAREVAGAQVELAKAGLNTSQILGGALRGALSLAAAGNLELSRAATIAANAMNLFGLRGKDVTKVADALATAANTTTADVEDFGMALTQGGAAAKQAGLTFEDTVVILEALATAGVKNSDAGTSMKNALISLIAPTKEQAGLAKELGISFIDQSGQMKNAAQVSALLHKATDGMTKAQRLATFEALAGRDGFRALAALYDAGVPKLEKYKKGLEDQGSAARVAAQMQDNLAGKLETLQGALETIAIQVGKALIPALSAAAEHVAGFLTDLGRARTVRAKFDIVFEGISESVQRLGDELRDLLFGELRARPIEVSDDLIRFKTTQARGGGLVDQIGNWLGNVDWSVVGQRIGDGIAGALEKGLPLAVNLARVITVGFVNALREVDWTDAGRATYQGYRRGVEGAVREQSGSPWFSRAVSAGLFLGPTIWDKVFGDEAKAATRSAQGSQGQYRPAGSLMGSAIVAGLGFALNRLGLVAADAAGGAADRIKGQAPAARAGGAAVGLGAVRGIEQALARIGAAVEQKMAGVGATVRGVSGEAGSAGASVGAAIVGGVLGPLGGLAAAVGAIVAGAVRSGIDWAKSNVGSTAEQYAADQVGKPIAGGIIRGFLLGSGSLPEKISEKVRQAIERGRDQVTALQGRFADAFQRLAADALRAFDAETDKMASRLDAKLAAALRVIEQRRQQLTPAEFEIGLIETRREQERLAESLAQAEAELNQAREQGDAAAIAAAEKRLALAHEDIRLAALRVQSAQQRAEVDRVAEAEVAATTARFERLKLEMTAERELKRLHLEADLLQLQTWLAKHPEEHRKAQTAIVKLLKSYDVTYADAGRELGLAFARGMAMAQQDVANAAKMLANTVERILRLESPAKEGPLSTLDTWWRSFADTLTSGLDTTAMRRALEAAVVPPGFGANAPGVAGAELAAAGGGRGVQVVNHFHVGTLVGDEDEAARQLVRLVEPAMRRAISYDTSGR